MRGYFKGAKWEADGRLYRALGLRHFLPLVAGGRAWQRMGFRSSRRWTRANVSGFVRASVSLEIAHSLSFVIMAMVAIHALLRGDYFAFTIIALANIVLNFLPILVCRYRRLSLLAALHKCEDRNRLRSNKTV